MDESLQSESDRASRYSAEDPAFLKPESEASAQRLGYLVPEFPGQTHVFFWRELAELRRLGISADLFSTRRPSSEIVCHAWSQVAMDATTYLAPRTARAWSQVVLALVRAPWLGLIRSLRVIAGARAEGVRGRVRLLGLLAAGARLADCAKRGHWNHVHVHSCADAAYAAHFAHLLSGVTYSLTLHGALGDYGSGQARKWRYARFGLVVTKTLLAELLKALPHLDPAHIDVAPMGVDMRVFRRQGAYTPYGGSGTIRVFSCGRLHEGKGHDVLITAIGLLSRRGLPIELTIAGEGPARASLASLAERLELGDSVVFAGALDETMVRSLHEQAHVFVLASRREALGVATMEAMAMGCPVVVTRVGGVHELVEDEVSGLMVPADDSRAIGEAIVRLVSDPGLAVRLGSAAQRRISDGFSSEVSARAICRRLC